MDYTAVIVLVGIIVCAIALGYSLRWGWDVYTEKKYRKTKGTIYISQDGENLGMWVDFKTEENLREVLQSKFVRLEVRNNTRV